MNEEKYMDNSMSHSVSLHIFPKQLLNLFNSLSPLLLQAITTLCAKIVVWLHKTGVCLPNIEPMGLNRLDNSC